MLFTKKEIAAAVKVSESTINRWMLNGLKFYRYEQVVRFKLEDVLEFMETVQKARKK